MSNSAVALNEALPAGAESSSGLMSPDVLMVVLTWVTFSCLLAVLYKFAWTPILKALDERENLLRKSVNEAEKVREELAKIELTRQEFLREAEAKARGIIDEAKKAAANTAASIEQKAKAESGLLLENARRDIQRETEKARVILREESAKLAVELAGKLIEKNLDTEANRKLIQKIVETS